MYENAKISVDPVIFTISENKLKVLLKRREKEPFKGKYELFGGLLKDNESAKQCLKRKLNEVLDTDKFFFQQFHTFTEPKRDPRERIVSIGYIAIIEKSNIKDSSNWFEANKLSELAFDHKKIIERAQMYLKENISLFAKHLLPQKFPLNSLQEVYETMLEKKLDNRNFRKQMINSGIVKETKELEKEVSHRPASLYVFGNR